MGLGNPGSAYDQTRHNAGAWFIEALCQDENIKLKNEAKFNARVLEVSISGRKVILALSNTYMNHSGQPVNAISKYYQIPPESILIIHDELDLPPGTLRFKTDGGHGGHNGLKDIIHHLKTKAFHRLRIGIGHPGNKDDVLDYVLHKPSISDEKKIRQAIENAISALPLMVAGDFQAVMQRLHSVHE